jgi:hypothetical protein
MIGPQKRHPELLEQGPAHHDWVALANLNPNTDHVLTPPEQRRLAVCMTQTLNPVVRVEEVQSSYPRKDTTVIRLSIEDATRQEAVVGVVAAVSEAIRKADAGSFRLDDMGLADELDVKVWGPKVLSTPTHNVSVQAREVLEDLKDWHEKTSRPLYM